MTRPKSPDPELLLKRFEEELDSFVFFHLGADAQVTVTVGVSGVEIAVQHKRVYDFSADIDSKQFRRMAEDHDYFETIMLEFLSRYRRHA